MVQAGRVRHLQGRISRALTFLRKAWNDRSWLLVREVLRLRIHHIVNHLRLIAHISSSGILGIPKWLLDALSVFSGSATAVWLPTRGLLRLLMAFHVEHMNQLVDLHSGYLRPETMVFLER